MVEKKETQEVKKVQEEIPYISVDVFLETAKGMYNMTQIQVNGFKTFVKAKGMYISRGYEPLKDLLESYLGK